MPPPFLALVLTPNGRLTLVQDDDAAGLEAGLARRLQNAFARGSGHGLLQLGANEIGVALSTALSYWRGFAAHYVTGICTLPDTGAEPPKAHIPVPANSELAQLVLAAPLMTGAEYLTATVRPLSGTNWMRRFESSCRNRNAGLRNS